MFWIIGADGAAKALAEMLSGKGMIPSTAGNIIGGQFEHAEWEGLRFYDLIFPLFIFVTGVAIVFSLMRLIEQESKSTAYWRVLRRSLLLFALGLVYGGVTESWPNSGVNESWPDIRLLSVLNRIALCYLFTSLLFLNLRLPGLIVAFVAILAGYWALMTFVPVSGIGAGSYAKDANLANWIDAQYLPGRKWNGAWDPEGLLSTLPAIGTCLLGVFAGLLLKEPNLQPHQKTLWLIGAGPAMIALGVLCRGGRHCWQAAGRLFEYRDRAHALRPGGNRRLRYRPQEDVPPARRDQAHRYSREACFFGTANYYCHVAIYI